MLEWLMVSACGGGGGALATLFAEQVRPRKKRRDADPGAPWDDTWKPFLLNVAGGAVVRFILWGPYTSSDTFESVRVTPAEVVASLLVGGGGVGGVRGYLHSSQEAESAERAAVVAADAAAELSDARNEPLDLPGGKIDLLPTPADTGSKERENDT